MRNRLPLTNDHADSGEDISMSSWVYGDPAPPILRAYVGDPSKIRLIHGGVKETHVFHLHNHQWQLEAENPVSTILDSITLSPQECYTLDILHGAGSLTGTIGDVIFHCHLYPHFHEGMWTLWRIHDRLEDGSGRLPDGTEIPPLMPLKDRIPPLPKDKEHPGYPGFINILGTLPLGCFAYMTGIRELCLSRRKEQVSHLGKSSGRKFFLLAVIYLCYMASRCRKTTFEKTRRHICVPQGP